MNIGAQHKFLKKNLTLSLNVIDPFSDHHKKNCWIAGIFLLMTLKGI
jgi:hypothetical protein